MRLLRLFQRGRGASLLGPLESRVMDILWEAGEPWSVRQVHTVLADPKGRPAYSTVKAVLTNLTAKRYLHRKERGNSNYFLPVESREDFKRRTVQTVIDALLENHRAPLIAHLVDRISENADDLRKMAHLIAAKRSSRSRNG